MNIMNGFQLEGRYPDYLDKIYKTYKKKNTGEILEPVKLLVYGFGSNYETNERFRFLSKFERDKVA
jgi:hypothetical protein